MNTVRFDCSRAENSVSIKQGRLESLGILVIEVDRIAG